MIRKIIGKTTILCVAVVATIMLVAVAWVVTSRFSRKTIDLTSGADDESTLVDHIVETRLAESSSSDIEAQKGSSEDTIPQFHQIEQDFAAASSNIHQMGETEPDNAGMDQKKEAREDVSAASDGPWAIAGAQNADIEQVRQEAGRIVGRSGLFSADPDPESANPVSTAEVHPEGGIPKDTRARRATVLEQKAYQEAKDKVDAMLRSLGYLDEM